VSVSAVLYPRWPPLLKIEISSNGENCSILSQKVPKFELYKHNDELCSNLGTFWLKIEQFWPFEEISIFSNGGHLGFSTALTDTILKGDHLRIISAKLGWVPFQNCVRQRHPVSKMAVITKNRNFFKWSKLLYFKTENDQRNHLRIISTKFG
jgi:hypothetical protein